MDLKKEKFRKIFPNLANEITNDTCMTKIESVRSEANIGKKINSKNKPKSYSPDVIDFLRRCENQKQAEDIICYLEKRKEISFEYAKKLRTQLKTKGIRSFGVKKEYIFDIMPVIALELENKPGELAKIATKFGKEGININYVYGSASSAEKKYLFVFCPEDIDLATKIFKK